MTGFLVDRQATTDLESEVRRKSTAVTSGGSRRFPELDLDNGQTLGARVIEDELGNILGSGVLIHHIKQLTTLF